MNLHELVSRVIIDLKGAGGPAWLGFTADSSVALFLPELTLCATIVVLLLARLFTGGRRSDAFWLALAGAGCALFLASVKAPLVPGRVEIFTGMLVYDAFTGYLRCVLLLFAVLFVLLTKVTGVPGREDAADIYTLVLGATLGMCLMVSANHLLTVFLAVEMASVPSYALAGLLKGRRLASEAALKYAVYGGGTAGVMLYGISLIAGLSNAAHLPTVAANLAERLPAMGGDERMVLMVASLLVMVGLAFKLSAVPFHFWCPDVFEGATAEVAAFLSVASKAAALGLLVRVALGLGGQMPVGLPAGQIETAQAGRTAAALAAAQEAPASGHAPAAGELGSAAAGQAPAATAGDRLRPLQALLARLIAFLAVVTCTFGNLAAYGQSNIKRLLAYSTIAHAGYMMMAVPALIALGGSHPQAAERAASALGVYIGVYLFLNLGAFAVVAVLRNAMRSEELRDYAGLIRHCPGIVICFSIILFGLVGVPPLSGFIGKFVVFAALWEGYSLTSQAYLLALLVLGGLNTVLSLFYYLRVIKTMAIDPDADTRGPVILPVVSPAGLYVAAVTLPTLLLFVGWNSLYEFSLAAARQLLG